MSININVRDSGEVHVSKQSSAHFVQSVRLDRPEQRELLESLARIHGFTLTRDEDEPQAPPTRSAWVVKPSTPGMPFSESDPRRSGYNSVPCDLQEALDVAGETPDEQIFLCIDDITTAFRVAVANYRAPAAYIIDNGDQTYTVVS